MGRNPTALPCLTLAVPDLRENRRVVRTSDSAAPVAIQARAPIWVVALLAGVLAFSLSSDLRGLWQESAGFSWLVALRSLQLVADHLSLVLVGRYPRAAAVTIWVALPIAVGTDHVGLTMLSVALVTAGVLALCTRAWVIAHAGVTAAWIVAQFVVGGELTGWTLVFTVVPGAAVGLILRYFLTKVARDRERARVSAETLARVHGEERRELSRELHDAVASELAVISMEAASVKASSDVLQLSESLSVIEDASRAASAELRLLVENLRDTSESLRPEAPPFTDPDPALAQTIESAAKALADRGFEVDTEIAGLGDLHSPALSPSTRHSYRRIIQEATTNIIKHAPPGAQCSLVAAAEAGMLRIRVANELGDGQPCSPAATVGAVGLAGINERAALTGGRASFGRQGSEWVVDAILPLGLTQDSAQKPTMAIPTAATPD